MVVHVVDVLALELRTVVVYLVLDVERTVHVEVVASAGEHHVHLCETVVGELEHLVQMVILLLGEVLLATQFAVQRACYVVAAVADTLYL